MMTLALSAFAHGEDPALKLWSDSLAGEKISVVSGRYRDIIQASLKEEGFAPERTEQAVSRPFMRTKGQSAYCSVGIGTDITYLIEIDRQSGRILQKGYFTRAGKPTKKPL